MLWKNNNAWMNPRKYIFIKIYHWFSFWALKTNSRLDQLIFGHSSYPYYALKYSYYVAQQSNSLIAIFNYSNLTFLKNSILCIKQCPEICQAFWRIFKSLWFPISKECTSFVLQNQLVLFPVLNTSNSFGNIQISFVFQNKGMCGVCIRQSNTSILVWNSSSWYANINVSFIWYYQGMLMRINCRFSLLIRN
jgi:hypothetical protein